MTILDRQHCSQYAKLIQLYITISIPVNKKIKALFVAIIAKVCLMNQQYCFTNSNYLCILLRSYTANQLASYLNLLTSQFRFHTATSYLQLSAQPHAQLHVLATCFGWVYQNKPTQLPGTEMILCLYDSIREKK